MEALIVLTTISEQILGPLAVKYELNFGTPNDIPGRMNQTRALLSWTS